MGSDLTTICEQTLCTSPLCAAAPMTLYPCAFQGKVHLELRLSEVITDTGVVCHKLATR